MIVSAPDLDRVLQNALLYVNPKSVYLKEVFFGVIEGKIDVYSSDDYVTVTDSAPVTSDQETWFSLSIEDTKRLAEWVKLDKKVVHKSTIIVTFRHTLVEASSDDSDEEISVPYVKEPNLPVFDIMMQLLDEDAEQEKIQVNAFRPERLAKLARLKADKEAPVDMRGVSIREVHFIQFKIGETITGCIKPVEREAVDDRFLWGTSRSTEESQISIPAK